MLTQKEFFKTVKKFTVARNCIPVSCHSFDTINEAMQILASGETVIDTGHIDTKREMYRIFKVRGGIDA